ncbi:MAG: hypothetical protein CMO81_06220 [Waddliaceae bacterium]|nr:hypothetical protein [Waddliaceae bacterium]
MPKAKSLLLKKIQGAQITQIVYVMARLGIADFINQEERSLDEISEELGLSLLLLQRLFPALESTNLVKRLPNGRYALTDEGLLLRKQEEDSLYHLAMYKSAPFVWRAMEYFCEGLSSGESPFELAHGTHLFDYLENNTEANTLFQDAMSHFERHSSKALIDLYDFSSFKHITDLGGGNGSFLHSVLERYPDLKALNFDLSHVIEKARRIVQHSSIEHREGSFFEQIPGDSDAFLLRNILHDWSDESCLEILKTIYRDSRPDSKLLLIETLISSSPDSKLGRFSNITMFMMTPGGRERSEEDLLDLCAQSGFIHTETIRCSGSKSLLEFTKK